MEGRRSTGSAPHGVLLVSVGSPSAPTAAAVRRFLSAFLGDPAVVDTNPFLWWLVRNLIVLPFRSRSSARLYRKIWTPEGSPLLTISRRQRDRLGEELGPAFLVELGMRYGEPSLADGLRRLRAHACDRVLILPMFPQASRATTGTVREEALRLWADLGRDGEFIFVEPYFAHEAYVGSLAARIRDELARGQVDHVVFSFHGLPVRYVEEGDPYRDHCEATASVLARALGLPSDAWTLAYQSRFGREPWLEPDTAAVVTTLVGRKRRVLVACPGFMADCLETLEEIDLRLRAAVGHRSDRLRVVPCLNDHPLWISGLATIARAALDRRAPRATAGSRLAPDLPVGGKIGPAGMDRQARATSGK